MGGSGIANPFKPGFDQAKTGCGQAADWAEQTSFRTVTKFGVGSIALKSGR
jgi:hypothetical protein